ncbi:MAG: SpoIIE family protein phosphatase [Ilumatobacter sp.]
MFVEEERLPAQVSDDVLRRAFNLVDSPFGVVDQEMMLVAVNDAYCKAMERPRDKLVNRPLFEIFPDNLAGFGGEVAVRESAERVFITGLTDTMPLLRYDVEDVAQPGVFVPRYWSVTISPVRNAAGAVEFITIHPEEVTDFVGERFQREASGELPMSATVTRAVHTVFSIELNRLRSLNSLAEALVGSETTEQVARTFLRDGLALVGGDTGLFASVADGLFYVTSDASMLSEHWARHRIVDGRDPISQVICEGEPEFFTNADEMLGRFGRENLIDVGVDIDSHHAWVVLPLVVRDGAAGVLVIGYEQPNPFTETLRLALLTMRNLIRQAAVRSLLRREQAETLASVATMLDPRLDTLSTIECSTLYRPAAKLSRSGGDWFDAIALNDHQMLFVIGDVANHGAHVVGEMARARSTIHALALNNPQPAEVAKQASLVLGTLANAHTTAVIAVYDQATMRFDWCVAGHPYPLLKKADGTVSALAETHGAPLGVFMPHEYSQSSIALEDGDTIVFYTDGLVERIGEPFSESLQRLKSAVQQAPAQVPLGDSLCRALIGDSIQADDIAILVVDVHNAKNDTKLNSLAMTTHGVREAAILETQASAPPSIPESIDAVNLSDHHHLPADFESLARIRRLAEPFGTGDPDRDSLFLTAVTEIATNAIEAHHAAQVSAGIDVDVDHTERTITIIDQGPGFDAGHQLRRPRPTSRENRGRGIRIARFICPSLTIQSSPTGTRVVLPAP